MHATVLPFSVPRENKKIGNLHAIICNYVPGYDTHKALPSMVSILLTAVEKATRQHGRQNSAVSARTRKLSADRGDPRSLASIKRRRECRVGLGRPL